MRNVIFAFLLFCQVGCNSSQTKNNVLDLGAIEPIEDSATRNKGALSEITGDYEIIKTEFKPAAKVYHIYLKVKNVDSIYAARFVSDFSNQFCQRECYIYLYDSKEILPLIGVYPLEKRDYVLFAEHLILMWQGPSDVLTMYPYKDARYEEYGGKKIAK